MRETADQIQTEHDIITGCHQAEYANSNHENTGVLNVISVLTTLLITTLMGLVVNKIFLLAFLYEVRCSSPKTSPKAKLENILYSAFKLHHQ